MLPRIAHFIALRSRYNVFKRFFMTRDGPTPVTKSRIKHTASPAVVKEIRTIFDAEQQRHGRRSNDFSEKIGSRKDTKL